jgi:hypothetical protein
MNAALERLRRAPSSALALAALVVGLCVSVLQPLLSGDSVDDPKAWVAALASVRDEVKSGDTVLVHPPWRDDAVDALEASGEVPAGVRITHALALRHGQAPGRVLWIADPSAPTPRARRDALRRGETREAAGLELTWLAAAKRRAGKSDLGARIAEATVRVEKTSGETVECRWNTAKQRHSCPGLPGWVHVGPDNIQVAGNAASCVWNHPTTKGKVITRFEPVALGKSLIFEHALSDTAAQNKGGKPVTAVVRVDGQQVGKAVRSNARGFTKSSFGVPGGAKTGTVEIEVTTPNDGARHYCWRLQTTGGAK